MADPIHVIVNPTSGSGAAGRMIPGLRDALRARDLPVGLEITEAPGHARRYAAGLDPSDVRPLLVVGGDGTLHEVANGLRAADDRRPVAILPVGTGNDFHRMVGSGPGIEEALDLVTNGAPRPFELGWARWEGGESYFVNLVGVGIDTEVLLRRSRFRRFPGLSQYLAAVLSAATHYRPIELAVEIDDGERLQDRTMITVVTVGPTIGGGFRVSPDARPDDGTLDFLFVEALSFGQVLRYLPRVLRGTHRDLPVVRMQTIRRIRLSAPDGTPFRFELDGELMDPLVLELEVRVVPEGMTVLCPPGGAG